MATRVPLTGTDYLDLREHLKVRDRRDVHTYSVDGMATDGLTYRFNVVKHQIATAAVRISSWAIDGVKPFPATFKERVAIIEDLDESVFERITTAINEFEKAQRAEEDEEKNAIADGASA